jgi:uncharacterized membrane protein (DUF4010 family)
VSVDDLLPFVYALAIGLLIGAERERSHPDQLSKLAGTRTFALVALCGAATAFLDPWLVVAGLPVLGALMVVGYNRRSLTDPGTTTEIALLATYLLGAMTDQHAPLAAALAIITTVLLMAKAPIHAFARDIVTETELEDALKFLVLAFVVLPLLPDSDLGPYGALNPRKIWLIVVALTGISWVGYIAVRTLGPRRGLLLTGLAGGFISASATTATMARRARLTATVATPVAAALLASLATFVQLVGILAVAAPSLVGDVWPAAAVGAVVIAAVALLGYRHAGRGDPDAGETSASEDEEVTAADRPFALRPALVLAAILTGALLLGRWAAEVLGTKGAVLAAGAAGLADAHAGALAPATLHEAGKLDLATALIAVGVAVAANTVTKLAVAVTAGGARFGLRFAVGLLPGVAAFLAVLVFGAVRA